MSMDCAVTFRPPCLDWADRWCNILSSSLRRPHFVEAELLHRRRLVCRQPLSFLKKTLSQSCCSPKLEINANLMLIRTRCSGRSADAAPLTCNLASETNRSIVHVKAWRRGILSAAFRLDVGRSIIFRDLLNCTHNRGYHQDGLLRG